MAQNLASGWLLKFAGKEVVCVFAGHWILHLSVSRVRSARAVGKGLTMCTAERIAPVPVNLCTTILQSGAGRCNTDSCRVPVFLSVQSDNSLPASPKKKKI